MKNVLLIGIGGVYNYGCEAIIRGTVAILRQVSKDVNISYASYNYEYDKAKLKDLDINIIKRYNRSRRWTFRNILQKISSMMGYSVYQYDTTKLVKGFDTLLSIGGDIYTLGPNNRASLSLPKYIDRCLAEQPNLKYILWGASVGPFTKNPEALRYFKTHLAKAHLIVAREQSTIDYLKTIGITDNVCFAPDPAYFVPFKPIKKLSNDKITIGINLSPLSSLYAFNTLEDAISTHAAVIEQIASWNNTHVVLIPHVLSPSDMDNDLYYLTKIYDALSEEAKYKVSVITEDNGFVGRKEVLSSLDYMIAARMHCGINAVTCGVPTLFLSYSAKAKGMVQYIYGNSSSVLPLEEFNCSNNLKEIIASLAKPKPLSELCDFNYSEALKTV